MGPSRGLSRFEPRAQSCDVQVEEGDDGASEAAFQALGWMPPTGDFPLCCKTCRQPPCFLVQPESDQFNLLLVNGKQ